MPGRSAIQLRTWKFLAVSAAALLPISPAGAREAASFCATSPVPEPLTMLVVGAALATAAVFGRRLPWIGRRDPSESGEE